MEKTKPRKRLISKIVSTLVVLVAIVVLACFLIVGTAGKYILKNPSDITAKLGNNSVGVVFGAGVENGKPSPLLKDRLDTAAYLLNTHKIRKILVSGDNRFTNYDEPQAMENYLVNKRGIDINQIQQDNAGRSTYETCERANRIFGLNSAVLVSESTHLPRAIYLCRSFGINAYGYSATGSSSGGLQVPQRTREVLARTKAIFNVYILGEQTVLGSKIPI